jgi:predicted RNA-binding protein (virulence factor B family)
MRVSEMLKSKGEFVNDEWVEGEVWRVEPGIGTFVIVERGFVGLLPESEPHSLQRGDGGRFRISNVLIDARIELSLRGHAHEELENDARRVLEVLSRPGATKVGDRSTPEAIRAAFGLSKKAFKRAAGRLLKDRAIEVDADGSFVPVNAASPPRGSPRS